MNTNHFISNVCSISDQNKDILKIYINCVKCKPLITGENVKLEHM